MRTDYEALRRAEKEQTRADVAAALGIDPANLSRSMQSYGYRSITLNETAISALLALLAPPADAAPVLPAGWDERETGGGCRVWECDLSPQFFAWMSDADDAAAPPTAANGVMVCVYQEGDHVDEPVDTETFDTIADAVAFVDRWMARYVPSNEIRGADVSVQFATEE